jgi:hypothetical protein
VKLRSMQRSFCLEQASKYQSRQNKNTQQAPESIPEEREAAGRTWSSPPPGKSSSRPIAPAGWYGSRMTLLCTRAAVALMSSCMLVSGDTATEDAIGTLLSRSPKDLKVRPTLVMPKAGETLYGEKRRFPSGYAGVEEGSKSDQAPRVVELVPRTAIGALLQL